MADRITQRDLEATVRLINVRAGFEEDVKAWTRGPDGRNVPTPGLYVLEGAYGGWALYQLLESGGEHDVLRCGYQPARDLYNRMRAFLDGWDAAEGWMLALVKATEEG